MANPYHSVKIRGTAELAEDPGKALPKALSQKYLGQDPPSEPDEVTRLIVRVTPQPINLLGVTPASRAQVTAIRAAARKPAGRLPGEPGINVQRTGGYGRRVIDLHRGWPVERLDLEPLAVAHAAELAPLLDDTSLHEFTGGAPLPAAELAARFARLAVRRSPDGGQLWGNWVMRIRATGAVAGMMQATLPAGGPQAGPAEVAWVVVHAAQGRGYAKEAARSLVAVLQQAGWTVVAHIHPGHLASQRVARAAGLSPTTEVRDNEVRWIGMPSAVS